jgi:hypothetical protein
VARRRSGEQAIALVPHDLPDYVERGGRQVYRPPYTARNAQVYGFVLKADRSAINALLQEALVEPSGGAVDYRCAHDHVMVTFTHIERLASGDPIDCEKGCMSEREVAVWCLAADVAVAANRLVWYIPYVFTDSGQTTVTGREVYGYPKQVGTFDEAFPAKLETGGDTFVSALTIDPFVPDQPASVQPIVSATRQLLTPNEADPVIGGSGLEGFTLLEEFATAFPGDPEASTDVPSGRPTSQPSAVITPLDAPPPPPEPPSPPWVRRLLETLQGRALTGDPMDLIADMVNNPTLVFLKQFRDVGCATKACYQAVVEAPLAVDPIGASYEALDPNRFEIGFAEYASHPIASDLGVAPWQGIKPARAFRATFDFDIQLGQEVWRAPT